MRHPGQAPDPAFIIPSRPAYSSKDLACAQEPPKHPSTQAPEHPSTQVPKTCTHTHTHGSSRGELWELAAGSPEGSRE
eukprot:10908899-Alexandrium_andersonii.AAC.1